MPPACAAAAEVYRWVDEQGHIQYGDKPPAQGAQRVEMPRPPATDPALTREQENEEKVLDALHDDRVERGSRAAESREQAQARRANCERAKKQLEETRNVAFLYEPTSDPDNPRILSNEQRASATRKMEADVQKWCAPALADH